MFLSHQKCMKNDYNNSIIVILSNQSTMYLFSEQSYFIFRGRQKIKAKYEGITPFLL